MKLILMIEHDSPSGWGSNEIGFSSTLNSDGGADVTVTGCETKVYKVSMASPTIVNIPPGPGNSGAVRGNLHCYEQNGSLIVTYHGDCTGFTWHNTNYVTFEETDPVIISVLPLNG